jgi:hypothetical protein
MHTLSATELLKVWERGLTQSPAQRALTLISAASNEMPSERIAKFSIAQRDMELLTLREQIFGTQLSSIANCPACGQPLEFSINGADLRAASEGNSDEMFSVTHAGYDVRYRLPNSFDLASLDQAADDEVNRRRLLARCVIVAEQGGAEIPAVELPEEVVTVITESMAEADPEADVQLALSCPECNHAWQAPLDILSYFWSEIHAWAGCILREIHALASAYGWREADVLALSANRRQAYLEMIEP